MRLGIAITRASNVDASWSTAHIALAALEAGFQVRFIEPWDYEVDRAGRLVARAHAFDPGEVDTREELCQRLQRRSARRRFVELARLDTLLVRINPLDTAVLTWAMHAELHGVPVLNPPLAALLTSHKGWLASLKDVPRPATLVTRSRAAMQVFGMDYPEGVIVKPARSSGGKGIAWVRHGREHELDVAIDQARAIGDGYVVVQQYLPEAEEGEKRLVWLDGHFLGGYVRQRAPGEFRHNLKRGGLPENLPHDEEDQRLLDKLTPHLRQQGIWFAGIDVIGRRVVEINTLNPGGLHLVSEFSKQDLAKPIIASLLKRISSDRKEQ